MGAERRPAAALRGARGARGVAAARRAPTTCAALRQLGDSDLHVSEICLVREMARRAVLSADARSAKYYTHVFIGVRCDMLAAALMAFSQVSSGGH